MIAPRVSLALACLAACSALACGGSDAPRDLELTLAEITLAPGEERYVCDYFPPTDDDRWLHTFSADTTDGTHHIAINRIDNPDFSAPEPFDCAGNEPVAQTDGALPGSAQLGDATYALPDGVAIELSPRHGLLVQQHLLNTSPSSITTRNVYRASVVRAADVEQPANATRLLAHGFDVPPGLSTFTERCVVSGDVRLAFGAGHMHQLAASYEADVNGELLFANEGRPDDHNWTADPGVALSAGDEISFSCTWGNDTGGTVNEGYGVYDEMCGFVGAYYPATSSVLAECPDTN